MSLKYTPTINKQEFDAVAEELRKRLKLRYEMSKNDADKPPINPATMGAFDHLPDLDSKTVARWSSDVQTFLGCKLNPRLIRKGGYNSFDDFWTDVSAKLRETCSEVRSTFTSEQAGAAL